MKSHISIITLGVSDLEASIRFYRDGLKLPMRDKGEENIAFFEMPGTWLALYPREKIADELDGGKVATPQGFRDFTLAHNVASPQEVDETLNEAIAAGAALLKPAKRCFGAVIPAILPTRTVFCGKSLTIRFFNCLSWCKITLG